MHKPDSREFRAPSPKSAPTKTFQTPIKELTTGSTFAGRYQVIEELGHGGMGRVYKVFDTDIKDVIRHPVFREGKATTGFIKTHLDGWAEAVKDKEKQRLALAAAAYLSQDQKPAYRPAAAGAGAGAGEAYSPWKTLGRFRLGE